MSVNSTDPLIGRLVDGRYQVRSRIARGGMATVYLATDLRLERRVAIKVMHGHLADDSKFRERFIQEARSAARLAHPNVVNVFDQGQDSDMAYLVMEYLPGITLRDLLAERSVLTTEQTFDILDAVLSGLAAAHKAGIVHRDLKPENVLLADDGRIKIGDFGLARAASANTATGAALLGTIAYLSPELVTRGIADTRSDIYAVGIMMYEMLAGEQPFKGEQPMQIAYQHANDSVPVPSTLNPRVPAELDELVLWATAREPNDRPRDATAMLEQLQTTRSELATALPTGTTTAQRTVVMPSGFLGSDDETQVLGARGSAVTTGDVAQPATASLAVRAGSRRRRGWWLFAAVLVLAGLAAGTGWYFGTGPGSLVTVPDSVIGLSVDAATAQLEEVGLVVSDSTVEVFDPFIAPGLVSTTDPAPGQSVGHETIVTLQLSKGPAPVVSPELVGLTEDAAIAAVTDAGLVLDANGRQEQFSSAVEAGVVIAAFGVNDDGSDLPLETGTPYFDQRPVRLVVSLGALPDVSGMSLQQAIDALAAVDVIGIEGSRTFNDTVPVDAVIRVEPQVAGAPIAPNDTVLIVISRGVEQIEVPDVVGMVWSKAKTALTNAGFAVSYNKNADSSEFAVVRSISPKAGTLQPKGSTITVKFLGE